MKKNNKKTTIISCVFLLLLIALLILVITLRIRYDEEQQNSEKNKLISLETVTKDFNEIETIEDYNINMKNSTNSFYIIYNNSEEKGIIEGTYVDGIISIKFEKKNFELAKKIYKELVNITCNFYKYQNYECNKTVDKFLNEEYDVNGLIYEYISDDEIYLKIDVTHKLELYKEKTEYNNNEFIDINQLEYTISNEEFQLVKPSFSYDSETKKIIYSAKVNNLLESETNVKIKLKLYDENNNEILTNEFDNSTLENKNEFDVTFEILLNDNIEYESIKYLSVDFIKE